ncbi:MAG: lysophospholipid acyltransferase family protein [Bacteroidota bacterium]
MAKINQKVGVLFLRLLQILLIFIGLRGTRLAARCIGNICYYLVPIRKKVVLENLAAAFPEKPTAELKKIARRTYQNITITFSELLLFTSISKNEMKLLARTENVDEMKSLVNENKGVVFWSGHIGSWEVGGSVLGMLFERPIYGLAKKQSNPVLNEVIKEAREAHGNKLIWLGVSVRHLIEVLRSGGIVGVVGDQRGPADSPRVLFFGRPTPFFIGTASIIHKTKCNAILAAAVREADGNYKGIVEKLSMENLPEEPEEQILEINQRYAKFLEKVIKQYPDQYFWMHKIWKY